MKKWSGPPQFEDSKTKSLMMLMTDMALVQDKGFRPHTEKYAKSEDAFFNDFSKAFAKLLELGVPAKNFAGKNPMLLPTVSDWEAQQQKK
jgi:cytochrome c peroxidase